MLFIAFSSGYLHSLDPYYQVSSFEPTTSVLFFPRPSNIQTRTFHPTLSSTDVDPADLRLPWQTQEQSYHWVSLMTLQFWDSSTQQSLNISKTRELIIDYRRHKAARTRAHQQLDCRNIPQIHTELKHFLFLKRKAQQHLHFLMKHKLQESVGTYSTSLFIQICNLSVKSVLETYTEGVRKTGHKY